MMRLLLPMVSLVSCLLLAAAPAPAYVVQERGGLGAAGNGLALGPDGNLWVAVTDAGKVVQMRPDGAILGSFPVGDGPTSVTAGPGGRVWVSVTGADKLVWFDATSPAPVPHDVSTASVSSCGPVAVEPGGDGRVYFSLPNDGSGGCATPSRVGYVDDAGSGLGTFGAPAAYDLEVSAGKLFIPDYTGNTIRRRSLGSPGIDEGSVSVTGGNPAGITVDGAGRIWVTLQTAGKVAHFPAAQSAGSAAELTPAGGTLAFPFGIAVGGDGRIYVPGRDSGNLARIDPVTTQFAFFALPAGSQPWQIVPGAEGDDLWMTDSGAPRLLRFVNGRPRVGAVALPGTQATSASLSTRVDPRGNATSVVFDYGTTAAYGQSTAPVAIAEGVGEIDVHSALPGLAPNTTYHVRARATNAEGETAGPGVTFTTPAAPAAAPALLAARTVFGSRLRGTRTLLTLRVRSLSGGETIRITCDRRGCPFRARTFRNVAQGSRSFDRLFRKRRLRPRTRVQVRVTKPGAVGRVTTLTTRAGKRPRIVRLCLPPGAARPGPC